MVVDNSSKFMSQMDDTVLTLMDDYDDFYYEEQSWYSSNRPSEIYQKTIQRKQNPKIEIHSNNGIGIKHEYSWF